MIAKLIPQSLKVILKPYYYNQKYKGDFIMRKVDDHYTYLLPDGRTIKSYENIAGDLGIFIKGYIMNYNISKEDTIIDAGAYIGAFSIYCSGLVGDGKIYAFEPNKENYKKLVANLELNETKNVIPLNLGLWSKKDKLEFNTHGASSSIFFKLGKGKEIINVISLDSLGLDKIDLIKMDIEGAEIEALKGMKKTLKNLNPYLSIASYYILKGHRTNEEVEKYLNKFGYGAYTGYPEHLTTWGTK